MNKFLLSFAVTLSMFFMISQNAVATKPEPIKKDELVSLQKIV